jgi:Na+/H+ antiporter NhaC
LYYIAAFLIYILGKTLDNYIRTGEVLVSSISIIPGAIAVWFIFQAVNHILQYFFEVITAFNFQNVLINVVIGGILGFLAIEIYYYVKQHSTESSPSPYY